MARRVRHAREPFGEINARRQIGMGNEIDQEVVEEFDEIRLELGGVLKEQIGDRARNVAATPGIATPDDLVQSRYERRGNGHGTQTRIGHAGDTRGTLKCTATRNLGSRW